MQELQSLEQSNSAIQKDIDSLKKELDYYTLVLERHKPFCCLKDAAPDGHSGSSAAPAEASASPHTAQLSLLATHLSPAASTAAYDLCSSTSTFTTSAHTGYFNQLLASNSVFLGDSPPLSTLEGAIPTSTFPPPPPRVALRDQPLSAPLPTPASKGSSLRNQASSDAPFPCAHSAAENRGAVDPQVHLHQLVHLKHLQPVGNSQHPSVPSSHLSPSRQSLSAVPAPAASFGGALGQNVPSDSDESPLSLLASPPPAALPRPDFINFRECFAQDLLPSPFDISDDLSLTELLSTDAWILE